MLDAMIASTLKKLLDKHVHFRNRASVEEQRAQKIQPILTREGKLLARSRSMFVQPEHMKQFNVYQICSVYACKMVSSKISMHDGIKPMKLLSK